MMGHLHLEEDKPLEALEALVVLEVLEALVVLVVLHLRRRKDRLPEWNRITSRLLLIFLPL